MALRPLRNTFLFTFLNETRDGAFVSKNKGNIIIVTPELGRQGDLGRWAKVLAVGNEVKDFGPGDIVLIAPGKWTTGFKHDEVVIWKSDDQWVLGIGDESMAYDYAVKPAF